MTLAMSIIEDNLRAGILAGGTNTNVIFQYPNAPRPEFPYTSLQYLTTSAYVDDSEIFDKTDDLVKTLGTREMFFTVNCYGDNARDEGNTLQTKLKTLTVREAMKTDAANISIWRIEPIIDATALVDSGFEQRVLFDIVLNVALADGADGEDFGYFDFVDYIYNTNFPL